MVLLGSVTSASVASEISSSMATGGPSSNDLFAKPGNCNDLSVCCVRLNGVFVSMTSS